MVKYMYFVKAKKTIVHLFMIILSVICPFDDQKPYFQDWWAMIRHLDLYTLLFLNESNLIFIFSQFQIPARRDQGSRRSPRLSGQIVRLCPLWFSPADWMKEILKSDILAMKSFTPFLESHLRFMAAHLETPWCRNVGKK